MNHKEKLYNAFAQGIRPPKKLGIIDWAKENVPLAQSKKSTYADLTLTKWLVEPLQTVIDGDYECIMFNGCTGAGKSTLMEILAAYQVLERAGPIGFFHQSATTAQAWMETRLMPMLKKNGRIAALFPQDRHKVKKDQILFPHMPMFVRGPSISNLQSLSLDGVILDEAWIYDDGVIQYADRRRHDRPFSFMFIGSQAGRTNTEWHSWHKSGRQFNFSYKCPVCGEYHPYDFKNLVFDKEDLGKGVKYSCSCGALLDDHISVRRSMSENGKYLEQPTSDVNPKRISFNFNALGNWSVSWETLVREFLEANEEKKRGNYEPLEKFRNQRLSEWWDNDSDFEFTTVETGSYSMADKEKWDITLLTCDVQGQLGDDYMFYSVMTFKKETGEARLLDFGRLAGWEDIKRKQQEWELPNNCVGIDCAYKQDTVKEFCAQNGYLALNGVKQDSFPVIVNGKTVTRLFGKIRSDKVLSGKNCAYVPFASSRIRTLAAGFRASGLWEIPSDTPEWAIKQLQAEEFVDGKWIQRRKDNHLIDTQAMACVLGLIHKVKLIPDTEE